MAQSMIEIRDLKKYFEIPGKGQLHAVDGISLSIRKGETVGLVGESGCGKSTVGNVIMRLLPATDGSVLFEGQDVLKAKGAESMALHRQMQIIFQDPYSSLNPKQTIRQILSAAYQIHGLADSREDREQKIRELLEMCGIEEYVLEKYPHELDGGRRQLIDIARALSVEPKFIVCDEPVSSLDVSIQATIINLLKRLQKERNISYLFISHDLSVVRHISQTVVVMYLGQIVEIAETDELFSNPLHPYSIALLSAIPKVTAREQEQSIILKGDVTSPINPEPGCRFGKRCWMCDGSCQKAETQLVEAAPGHYVRCPRFAQTAQQRENYLRMQEVHDVV